MPSSQVRTIIIAFLGLCLWSSMASAQSVRVIKLVKDTPAPSLEVVPATPPVPPTAPILSSGSPPVATPPVEPGAVKMIKITRGDSKRVLELTATGSDARPARLPDAQPRTTSEPIIDRPGMPGVQPQLILENPPSATPRPLPSIIEPMPPTPPPPPPGIQARPQPGLEPKSAPVVPALPPAEHPSPMTTNRVSATPDGPIFWFSTEALLWWMRSQSVPSLVSNGTLFNLGDVGLNADVRSGARFAAGMWIDEERSVGFLGEYFFLERSTDSLGISMNSASLSRPVISITDPPTMAVAPMASNLTVSGTASAVEGASGLLRFRLLRAQTQNCVPWWRMDVLGGYRFLGLAESLTFTEQVGSPGMLTREDVFQTRNRFNGFDLGLVNEFSQGPFSLEVTTRLAMGWMDQQVNLMGATTSSIPGLVSPGGTLVQASNMGSYRRSEGAVLPELGVTLGWQIAPYLRLSTGYNLIYVSDVVRPGDQVDTSLVQATTPGAATSPGFAYRTTDLWLQGLKLGLELKY
ncbi:MAG: BBP7 family outer membrane beta-barrel protein [Gemmataceae bacterium]